jgi:hypothetical protein
MKIQTTQTKRVLIHKIEPNPLGKNIFVFTDVDDQDMFWTWIRMGNPETDNPNHEIDDQAGGPTGLEPVALYSNLGEETFSATETEAEAVKNHKKVIKFFTNKGFTAHQVKDFSLTEESDPEETFLEILKNYTLPKKNA